MRLAILGAVIGATVLGTLPASAEVVIRDRDDAVVVHKDVHHPRWWHHHAECRTIKVRKHLPNGNVIIKTRHVCD
jgi:hypothetical protein